MSEKTGYIHPEALVDVEWLQAHLTDPTVRVIEVDVDTAAYEQGHIPGAVDFNWQKELQDQVIRAPISKAQLEVLLSRVGVSNDTTIVLYGDHHNWFAAWAFWLLKYYGHRDVRLLKGTGVGSATESGSKSRALRSSAPGDGRSRPERAAHEFSIVRAYPKTRFWSCIKSA